MAKTTVDVFKKTIKHKGLHDFGKLLKEVKRVADEKFYYFFEKKYKHRADEKELDIYLYKKVNEYLQFDIDIYIWANHYKDVEVVEDGKQKTLNQSSLIIDISCKRITDMQDRFKGNFLEKLHKWYEKYILKNTIEDVYEANVLMDVYKIVHAIHEVLGMEQGVV